MAQKAIFLDKDGTLIVDVPYNVNPELIVLAEKCLEGLKKLQDNGYLLIVISNQSGVARGYFDNGALKAVEDRLRYLLFSAEINLTDFYYCPHHPDGSIEPFNIDCDCRKPAPGMLFKAATAFGIDLNASWMIGDILNDVEAGKRAGCNTILVDNGNETEWVMNEFREPTASTQNIDEAAEFILRTDGTRLETL